MLLKNIYNSPMGKILILVDEKRLKGLWFEDQKYFGAKYDISNIEFGENEVIQEVRYWLKNIFQEKILKLILIFYQ
ncbi:Uncharacterised protein [Streptobacillus moniliformis]|nr:Uncharacterised protein [Streptobacillus moniliformis]